GTAARGRRRAPAARRRPWCALARGARRQVTLGLELEAAVLKLLPVVEREQDPLLAQRRRQLADELVVPRGGHALEDALAHQQIDARERGPARQLVGGEDARIAQRLADDDVAPALAPPAGQRRARGRAAQVRRAPPRAG